LLLPFEGARSALLRARSLLPPFGGSESPSKGKSKGRKAKDFQIFIKKS
jgi:hypothetical protein